SIGVTLFRGNELSIDVLLKQADMALYQAKGAGRNTVRFFNPAMQAAIESRAQMENALRHGLQQNEFKLFYQPQFDQQGEVTGAEALLRWLPPGQPSVSPVQFIPLAEETGLIIPLGLWVLQTACAQLKDWSNSPGTRDLQISINVSARQFRQADFVEQVFDTLKQTGINPALLKLELTESVVLDNVEDVITRMEQIKGFGVTFSIDDFGTGFSSLSYLKRLPLDEVKIDQSFVRDITTDPSDAAIVRAIIAMSRSLGLHVIAEGVETEAQLQFLKENGCANFQGFLFSKAIPIEEWKQVSFNKA
ncbi:MAG: putative bifunctional diguanylate cyclase/phosphodiesterase, partial [Burkholderiaceae bacterium]